jgi:hypothetical protein
MIARNGKTKKGPLSQALSSGLNKSGNSKLSVQLNTWNAKITAATKATSKNWYAALIEISMYNKALKQSQNTITETKPYINAINNEITNIKGTHKAGSVHTA